MTWHDVGRQTWGVSGGGRWEDDHMSSNGRSPLGNFVGVIALLALGALILYGVQSLSRNMPGSSADAMPAAAGAGSGLHALVAKGDAAAVQRAATAGADVNAAAGAADVDASRVGMTPLMIACVDGNALMVKALLDAKAKTELRTDDGRTALMYAAGWGDSARVQTLLDAGANANARASDGWTALMFAAARGEVESVRALVGAGADVNASNKWRQTALIAAARSNSLEKLAALLDSGATVNASDQNGETALHVAASNEVAAELLDLLIKRGAAVDQADQDGITPLMRAAERADKNQVQVLLAAGASTSIKDKANGWTAADWAATRDDEQGRAVAAMLDGVEQPFTLERFKRLRPRAAFAGR